MVAERTSSRGNKPQISSPPYRQAHAEQRTYIALHAGHAGMYVCMYVYIIIFCICTGTACTHADTHTHTDTDTDTHTHTHRYIYIYIYIYR